MMMALVCHNIRDSKAAKKLKTWLCSYFSWQFISRQVLLKDLSNWKTFLKLKKTYLNKAVFFSEIVVSKILGGIYKLQVWPGILIA